VGTCQHGIPRTQVADREDGLWIWRVAADIFNIQPTRGGPPAWVLGAGLAIPRLKKQRLRNVTKGLGLGRIFDQWRNLPAP